LFEKNTLFLRKRPREFQFFVRTLLQQNLEIVTYEYVESESQSRDMREIAKIKQEQGRLLFLYGYGLIRLFQLENDIGSVFKEKNEVAVEETLFNRFMSLIEQELTLLSSMKLDLLSYFDYGRDKSNQVYVSFKNDSKTLEKIIKWGNRYVNQDFFDSIQNMKSGRFLFYDRDWSPRHITLEKMNVIWNVFQEVYKEFFGIECLFDNPSQYLAGLNGFNRVSTSWSLSKPEQFLELKDQYGNSIIVDQEILRKSVSTFLPICQPLEQIKPIEKMLDTYKLNDTLFYTALGCKTPDNMYLLPIPFWLKKKISLVGPRFLKKLETSCGNVHWDLFCEELEFLIEKILDKSLAIQPALFYKPLEIQKISPTMKIIDKNVEFRLKDGKKGEIDLLVQKDQILYLLEAKSLRKGRKNKEYIKKKSPKQCDRYTEFILEKELDAFLSSYGLDGQISEVRILVVTSGFPDFLCVESPDTGNIYGVISSIDFFRLFLGFWAIMENKIIDKLIRDFSSSCKDVFVSLKVSGISIAQTKYRLINYKRQIYKIYTQNWLLPTARLTSMPSFSYPVNGITIFDIKGSMKIERYFRNEPDWFLKHPKKLADKPLKIYLATQLGAVHIKTWCRNCESCFIVYTEELEGQPADLKCYFCKKSLTELPDAIRENYISELQNVIVSFKFGLSKKILDGDLRLE
ncbi:MAG: hypothetical protein ACFFD4_36900, partial [Candidatus Odinarchaeota archaeon]